MTEVPKNKFRQIRIFALLVVLLFLFIYLFFQQDLPFNLAAIKRSQDTLSGYVTDHFLLAAVTYSLIYITGASFGLPISGILSLSAGAFFGLFWGVIVATVSCNVGAMLSFLLARFLFQDWIERTFPKAYALVTENLEKNGRNYIFSLRVAPIFPYFVINAILGITRVSVYEYALFSFLGMLPGTILYVNAGRNLSGIQSVDDCLTPQVLGSLILLAIVPWIAKTAIKKFSTSS